MQKLPSISETFSGFKGIGKNKQVSPTEHNATPSPPQLGVMSPCNHTLRRYHNTEVNCLTRKYRELLMMKMEAAMEAYCDVEAVVRVLKSATDDPNSLVRISDYALYIDKLQIQLKERTDTLCRIMTSINTDVAIMRNWKCQFARTSHSRRRANLCPCKEKCPVKMLIHTTLFVNAIQESDTDSIHHHLTKAGEYR